MPFSTFDLLHMPAYNAQSIKGDRERKSYKVGYFSVGDWLLPLGSAKGVRSIVTSPRLRGIPTTSAIASRTVTSSGDKVREVLFVISTYNSKFPLARFLEGLPFCLLV